VNPERARRALWRLMRATEGEVETAAREASRALEGASEATVRDIVRASVADMGDRVSHEIQRRIEQSVRLGGRAGFGALGGGDPAAARWLERNQDALVARFSPSIVGSQQRVLRQGLAQVETVIRSGRSAQQAAYAMRERAGYTPRVGAAQAAQQAAQAAKQAVLAAGPVAQRRYGAYLARLERYAARLGQQMDRVPGASMRGATIETAARIQEAVDRLRPDLVDESMRWHVYHKEAYHLRMTARTEMSRAYNGTFVESAESLGAERVRWVVNKVRHVPDICDDLGMSHGPGETGQGVYRIGALPELPAHPNCLCYWEYVIE